MKLSVSPLSQKKRYKDQLKISLRKCNIKSKDLDAAAAADRDSWWQHCLDGTLKLEEERAARRQQQRLRRNTTIVASTITTSTTHTCPTCNKYVDPGLDSLAI